MTSLLDHFVAAAMEMDRANVYIPPNMEAVLRQFGFIPHRSYLRPPRPPRPVPVPCQALTKAKTPCKHKCAPGLMTCLVHSQNPTPRGYPLPSKRCPELVNGEQCKCPKFLNLPLCWRHAKRAKILPPAPEVPTECSICYSEFSPGSTVKTICGHYFHDGCFNSWKQSRVATLQKVTCPMCRRNNPKPRPVAVGTGHQNSQANILVL